MKKLHFFGYQDFPSLPGNKSKKAKILILTIVILCIGKISYCQYTNMEIAPISHNQSGVTHVNAVNSDIVFDMRVNTSDSTLMGATSWVWTEKSGDTDNAFSVSSAGVITVSDATKLAGSENYALILTVNNGIRSEDYTASIHVAPNDSSKYIDASSAGGTGTFANPYNDMNDPTYTQGYYYFVKRGKTHYGERWTVENKNNPTKWITIAAYGQGAAPHFIGNPVATRAVYIGLTWENIANGATQTDLTQKVRISDLYFSDYDGTGSNPVHVTPGTAYIELYRLVVEGASSNGCIYFHWGGEITRYNAHGRIEDCTVSGNIGSHGIKIEHGGMTLINNVQLDCEGCAIQSSAPSHNNLYLYNYSRNCLEIHFRAPLNKWYWGTTIGKNSGIVFEQSTEEEVHGDSCVVKYSYLDNPGNRYYRSAIRFRAEAVSEAYAEHRYDSIVGCVFNFKTGAQATDGAISVTSKTSNLFVDRCVITDATGGDFSGVYVNSSNSTNLKFQNMLIHGLTYNAFNIDAVGSGMTIDNCTMYGNGSTDLNNASGTSITARNNLHQTISGTWSTSNNLDLDGVTLTNYFTDYLNGDFSLKSTATLAINSGAATGLDHDIVNTTRSTIDIGAYEYSGGGNPTVSISATDASAGEATTPNTGTFTITRTGPTTGSLSVNYTKTGTTSSGDYTETLTGSVTIADGNSTATITITPVDDATCEGNETVILTLGTGVGYTIGSPSAATVTIADNDCGSGGLIKTVKVNMFYTSCPGGTEWNDFTGLSAGSSLSLNDSLGNSSGYTIYNEDAWAGSANTGMTSGPYPQNVNISNWNLSSGSTNDIEFRNLNNSNTYSLEFYGSRIDNGETRQDRVTIGSGYDIIDVTDNTSDKARFTSISPSSGTIRASLTVESGSYGYLNAIVLREYSSSPVVTISATDASAGEATTPNTGTFTISRGAETSGNLTVNYATPTGTATLNTDYTMSASGNVTIPDGNSTATIIITPEDDAMVEDNETVILTLVSGSGYNVGSPSSATVTIADNDSGYENPFAHWKFEQNGNDSSGNGHTATLYGSPTYVAGEDGYGINLNTTDRYVDCGAFNLGNTFTITGWYKFESTTNKRALVANSTSSPNGFILFIDGPTGQFTFMTGNGSSYLTASSTTGHHISSTWIHFAVVVDKINGTCDFYVNGEEETNSSSIRNDFSTNSTIRLGRTTNDQWKLWGYVDDVRLYDYKLSGADISDICNLLKSAKLTVTPDLDNSGIAVFPVPCTDFLTISGIAEIRQIVLVNLIGEAVLEQNNMGTSDIRLDVSSLNSGFYCLKLVDHSGKISAKSIIKR